MAMIPRLPDNFGGLSGFLSWARWITSSFTWGRKDACVEAGPRGVNVFNLPGPTWDALGMIRLRGPILDTLQGVAAPIKAMDWSNRKKEIQVREAIAQYCLAQVGKPYNVNYFNPQTEEAFYCSQLAYLAYLPHGINLIPSLGFRICRTRKVLFSRKRFGADSPCKNSIQMRSKHLISSQSTRRANHLSHPFDFFG